jgi:Domain of unknown function (DUF4349)
MRVIPFPSPRMSPEDALALARIEAALDGDGTGAEADLWRELRADVRALPEPIDPAFASALEQRVRVPDPPAGTPRRLGEALARRRGPVLAVAASLVAILVAVLAFGVSTSSRAPQEAVAPAAGPLIGGDRMGPRSSAGGSGKAAENGPVVREAQLEPRAGEKATAESPSSAAGAAGEAPGEASGRLQQLGASLTLSAGNEGVQGIADRVGRATVVAGGFVQSSRVQVQNGSPGEASMTLVVPSAKLQAMLAHLERIAAVRAESQSLQDITSEYHAAGAHLSAARAERTALLRALANATTAASVESLHARLAEASREIAAAERQQASVSHRASQAQVEVTVLGQVHHGGGSTLDRGLHDAGNVLTVTLAVLVVAAAVLVPLGLLLAVALTGGRWWRRQRRERVLGSG